MTTRAEVREAAMQMARVDTHAHIGMGMYAPLVERAAAGDTFPTTMQLSGARMLAEGCRELYGIDPGAFLRSDASLELFAKAAELQAKGHSESIEAAMKHANIEHQFMFAFHTSATAPFAGEMDLKRFSYLAYIDQAISGHDQYPCPDLQDLDFCYYDKLYDIFGDIEDLDHYMSVLDEIIDGWRSWGVVGMKVGCAYTTGLSIMDPTPEQARTAFAKKRKMTHEDFLLVHDYALRHSFEACERNNLPVVIHTGFLIWGRSNIQQANPMLLHDVLCDPRYADLTFVLLHGGFPYTGETGYLAGMFSNVVIDFTWLSWISPIRFKQALKEWLGIVPHDRICWGSDSSCPESIAGIDIVTRRLIAEVLEQCMSDRIIDERYAMEFVGNCYRNTARRVFGLG